MRRPHLRLTGLLSLCVLILWLPAVASGQTLRIYHIDVEQGDATLLVTPSGKSLLVDSGKNGHGPRIRAAMQQAGVAQIDAFVATHYHEDHYGGIDDLVNAGVPVVQAFDRGDKDCCLSSAKKNEKTFKDYQQAVGQHAVHLQRGMRIELDPAVTITCISSGGVVIGETDPHAGEDENDMSVSLLITFGGFRYFVGGDVEGPTEAKIAARDLVLDVDVYQADHHGSHTSSSAAFLADLKPTVVVVSNGSVERYKHPRSVTLQAYAAAAGPPVVFQTNKCFFQTPCANVPDAFIADPDPGDDDGTVLVTVSAAGSTYTVTFGATSQQFTTKAAPPAPAVTSVLIETVLPNPVGNDEQLEEVTLRSTGTQTELLNGWRLLDRSGFEWDLAGSLKPSESRTFRRNGRPMSLNNNGDDVMLVDAEDVERDRFTYTSSVEGVAIKRN
jgi:competence protein ComEC